MAALLGPSCGTLVGLPRIAKGWHGAILEVEERAESLPTQRRVLLDQAQARHYVLEPALFQVPPRHLCKLGYVGDVPTGLLQRLQFPVHA